jgi:hypothetical protein
MKDRDGMINPLAEEGGVPLISLSAHSDALMLPNNSRVVSWLRRLHDSCLLI